MAQKRLKRSTGITDPMAESRISHVWIDFDGTLGKDTVSAAIREHLPAQIRGRLSNVATNIIFPVCDILDLKKQYVANQISLGKEFEINGPVLDWMYWCREKGIEVTVLTRNCNGVGAALKDRGICEFEVLQKDNKVSFIREQQVLNPNERGILLDDSIKDALRFRTLRLDGYVLYVNGHNTAAAHFLSPFIQTATDGSLKYLIRDNCGQDKGISFARTLRMPA